MSLPPSGWYPDPAGSPQQRWWDGATWSLHTRDRAGDPYEAPAAGVPAVGDPYRDRVAGAWTPQAQPYQPPVHRGGQPGAAHYQQQREPVYPSMTPERGRPAPVQLGGIGWRFLAWIIDIVALSVVSYPFVSRLRAHLYDAFVAWANYYANQQGSSEVWHMLSVYGFWKYLFLLAAAQLALVVVYDIVTLRLLGSSVGQLACRLRVAPAAEPLSPLSWRTILIRTFGYQLFSLTGIMLLVSDIVMLSNERRQSLVDQLARTVVVRRD